MRVPNPAANSIRGGTSRGDPFQSGRVRRRQHLGADCGQCRKVRVAQIALQLPPDARDQRQITRLATLHCQTREDAEDPQRALGAKGGIGAAQRGAVGPGLRGEIGDHRVLDRRRHVPPGIL